MSFRAPSMKPSEIPAQPIRGRIRSFESFGSVDGPGLRYIVFLAGCPLRCLYCHNPETWNPDGDEMTAAEVWAKAVRYRPYWKGGGGITVSGGEPMGQMPFVTELFRLAKENGATTVLDTSGAPFAETGEIFAQVQSLLAVTDLVLLDIKAMDETLHRKLTGKSNVNILAFARYLDHVNKPMWIRHVLVPDLTDSLMELHGLARFVHELRNVERLEVLPYHALARQKYQTLGLNYPLGDTPEPTKAQVQQAEAILGVQDFVKYKAHF